MTSEEMINIKRENELMKLVLKHSNIGIWQYDLLDKKYYLSPECFTMLGYQPDELPNKLETFIKLVHSEDQKWLIPKINEFINNKNTKDNFEYRLKAKDNSWKWILSQINIEGIDKNSNPIKLIGSNRDITKYVEEISQMIKIKARENLILTKLPMAFYIAYPYGDFGGTWVSHQIDIIAGFSPDDFIQNPGLWVERLHPDDRAMVLQAHENLMNIKTLEIEYRWQTKNGDYKWILDQSVILRDENNNPKEIVGAWLDITDKRNSYKGIQESEQQFRQLIDTSPVAQLIVDNDMKIIQMNHKFTQLFGYDNNDIKGIEDWWPRAYPDKEYREKVKKEALKRSEFALKHKQQIEPQEVIINCKDGTKKNIVVMMSSISEKNIVIFQDVTEFKKSQEKVKKIVNALKESEEKYVNLIATTNTGFVVIDGTNGNVVDANQVYVEMTGHHSLEEIKGRSVDEWTAPYDRERNGKEVKKCFEKGFIQN